jgi:hypothetical protein
MSTYEQTHQVIIGGDFNEEITNINTTTRQQYAVEFMAEHQMYTKEMGPTFINAKGKDCTSIDYILFQESYREQISSIKKIDVIANVSDHYPILLTLKYKKPIDKNQKPAHTQKTKNKWDTANKDKYVELVNEGIQSSDLTLETAKDVEKAFLNLNSLINNAASAITPKPKIRKNKPKLQVMSEEILKVIQNKKTAFYNWKTNGRIKDIHDPFLLEKKITTYELRKNCRKEMAQKRIQERQTITEAMTSDRTLFYRIIRQQRGKLTRFIDELYVGSQTHNTEDQILEGWKSH